jgi:hypothetical protein
MQVNFLYAILLNISILSSKSNRFGHCRLSSFSSTYSHFHFFFFRSILKHLAFNRSDKYNFDFYTSIILITCYCLKSKRAQILLLLFREQIIIYRSDQEYKSILFTISFARLHDNHVIINRFSWRLF